MLQYINWITLTDFLVTMNVKGTKLDPGCLYMMNSKYNLNLKKKVDWMFGQFDDNEKLKCLFNHVKNIHGVQILAENNCI